MAHDFLIFDFETNEEAAQQARHRVEGWTQGFRLGKKMLLKFEREEAKEAGNSAAKTAGSKKKSAAKENATEGAGRVRVLIRLDFSEHEKLSHQRWLDRIPTEEPFKAAKTEIVRQGDPEFGETAELFDSLS
jgi:hypothetical protein